jgi:hypothetical protein
MKTFWLLLVASGFCFSLPGGSTIVRRHDRDDAKYLELGAKYPAVTRFSGGTATLIGERWLLTAGHVADNLSPFDQAVRFGDRNYEIEAVVLHPRARHGQRTARLDIALVKLRTPVLDVTPIKIYERKDEVGREIMFVGPGMYGDGNSGPQGDDGRMRGATNRVDSAMPNYLKFTFDAPPAGTELEGISGPGDSGGPALFEADGETWVLGVSSANDDKNATGPCRYHSDEYYARVSTVADWIRQTQSADVPPREPPAAIVDLSKEPWPSTREAEIAAAFFAAYATGTDAALEKFERDYRAGDALRARSIDQRLESWRANRQTWGKLTAARCATDAKSGLHVLVHAKAEGIWKSFRFELQPSEPHKLAGIAIASPVFPSDDKVTEPK